MAATCSKCSWKVPDLINGLCEFCHDELAQLSGAHKHECEDCGVVFDCFGNDCANEPIRKCPDCWMQLRLLEFND